MFGQVSEEFSSAWLSITGHKPLSWGPINSKKINFGVDWRRRAFWEERGGWSGLWRDCFTSVISGQNWTVSAPKERQREGECNGVIGLHWISLFVDWFQVNTTNVRTRDTSHPLSCIPRSIRLLLSALCTLFACTCHFASSSGLELCLSGYLLFYCSSYPLPQLSSKTEMAVRQH